MRRAARERSKVLRAVSAILVLLGITIWFFFATMIHERRGPVRAASTSLSDKGLEHLRLNLIELARGRRSFRDFGLHVVVRKRVPTGPDPIHNSLAALKKSYAEMILNTTREADARVAEADLSAASFHRDLCFARDEAVRMLLKLKLMLMLDTKMVVAETVAKKEEQIVELEAQLEEAESKILDLRMELESIRDELEVEKAKNNVQSSEENKSSSNDDLPDHHFNSFEPIVPYSSDSELENVANRDIKDKLVSGRETAQMSCNGINLVRQMADPGLEGAVGQKTDLATMIMGTKEPKLYRNGCTQRVRAFEGHLLQGTLGCELNCGTHDKGENEMRSFSQSQDMETAKVLPPRKLEIPAITSRKQRKTTRGKKSKSAPIPVHAKQWRRQLLVSSLSLCKSYSTKNGTDFDKGFLTDQMRSVHDFDVQDSPLTLQKRLPSGDTIEGKAVKHKGRRKARRRKNLNNSFRFPSNQSNITELSGFSLGPAIEGKTKSKEPNGLGIINGEKYEGSSGSGVVAKEEDGVEDYSLSAKRADNIATNNVLVPYKESEPGSNSVNSEVDLGRRSVQSDDNRLVKYTFQRKRKRAFVSNDCENKAPLRTRVKKQAGDVMKSRLVSKGCKEMKEPSRDSRRLAQVARQLIALSGKRW